MKRILSAMLLIGALTLFGCSNGSENHSYQPVNYNDTQYNNDAVTSAGPSPDTIALRPTHTLRPGENAGEGSGHGAIIPSDTSQLPADSLKQAVQINRMLEDYLEPGRILWILSNEMKANEDTMVVVRLIRDTATGELTVGIDTSQPSVHIQPIATTSEMQVFLNGDPTAFRITPLGSNGQMYVSTRNYSEWCWAVTPLKPGTFFLSIDVVAKAYIDGKAMPPVSRIVYSNKFKVKATMSYRVKTMLAFCKEYWAILTAAATGLSALIWGRQRARRRRK